MKKSIINLIALIIVVVLFVTACTQSTTPDTNPNPDNNDSEGNIDIGKEDSIVTKEIPESFPEELVPLYEVDAVEGIISVGEDYHQAYFYSHTSREDILKMYEEFYADKDIQIFQNNFSYELSGNIDGHKIRMYIMPYNEEDTNAVTTSSQVTTQEIEPETETTEAPEVITDNDNKRFATTVIIFIYAEETSGAS
jgi:hypothetical protein